MSKLNEQAAAFLGGMFESPLDLSKYFGAYPAAKVLNYFDPHSKSQVGPDTLSLAKDGIDEYYAKVPKHVLGESLAGFRAEMMDKHPTVASAGEVVATGYIPAKAAMRTKPFLRFTPKDGLYVDRFSQGLAGASAVSPIAAMEFLGEPGIDSLTD